MNSFDAPILIAEDDILLSRCYADNLAEAGYRTKVVTTSAEGIRCAETEAIAVGLVDFELGDTTRGHQLVTVLVERNIPTVVCSGYSESHIRERLGILPISILCKPVSMNRLVDEIGKAATGGGTTSRPFRPDSGLAPCDAIR